MDDLNITKKLPSIDQKIINKKNNSSKNLPSFMEHYYQDFNNNNNTKTIFRKCHTSRLLTQKIIENNSIIIKKINYEENLNEKKIPERKRNSLFLVQ